MRDYISIGPSPCNEECAQVGQDNYPEQSKKECRAFLNQLSRVFGEPPGGAHLGIKSFPHDFGTYREVVCYFDDDVPEARDFAFMLEGKSPENWDEEAHKELSAPAAETVRR